MQFSCDSDSIGCAGGCAYNFPLYMAFADPMNTPGLMLSPNMMPVPLNSGISYFDGPPVVSCAAFAMHKGKMTEPVDAFAHPFWDTVRDAVSKKAIDMRRQGFFGAAMLPMTELEYTGIVEKLAVLDRRFTMRG